MDIVVFLLLIAIVYGISYVIVSGLIDLAVACGKRVFLSLKQYVNIS
jgi:hypothetical protein